MPDARCVGRFGDEGHVVVGWYGQDVIGTDEVKRVLFEVFVVGGIDGGDNGVVYVVFTHEVEVEEHDARVKVRLAGVD